MRIITIKQDTDSQALSARLLDARLSADKMEAALNDLRTFNPHADLDDLKVGTVLFVPDAPAYKVSETESPFDSILDDFEKMVKSALSTATAAVKNSAETRAAEVAEVSKTLKTAAFKKLGQSDAELQVQIDAATATLKKQKEDAEKSRDALELASKNALTSLRDFTRRQ